MGKGLGGTGMSRRRGNSIQIIFYEKRIFFDKRIKLTERFYSQYVRTKLTEKESLGSVLLKVYETEHGIYNHFLEWLFSPGLSSRITCKL